MSEELERLRDLWRRELMLRVRLIERGVDRIHYTITQSPTSQASWSPPTAAPTTATTRTPAPSSWLTTIAQKLTREALTQFGLWLLAKLAMWVAPWLVAWWTMGGAVLRFLERWAPFLFG